MDFWRDFYEEDRNSCIEYRFLLFGIYIYMIYAHIFDIFARLNEYERNLFERFSFFDLKRISFYLEILGFDIIRNLYE